MIKKEDCKFFRQHFCYNQSLQRMIKVDSWHCVKRQAKTCQNCAKYEKILQQKLELKYDIISKLANINLQLKHIEKIVLQAGLAQKIRKDVEKS